MIAMQTGCGCSCGGNAGPKIIFSCSGCADVGELADQAARKLTRDGAGRQACLAGISGRISSIVKINHLRLSDLGFEKGKTKVSGSSVASVISKAMIYL